MNPLVNQDKRHNTTAQPIIANQPQIIPIGENLKKVDAKIPNIPPKLNSNEDGNSGLLNINEFRIADELENLYIVAGFNEHVLKNANHDVGQADNTRVETDRDLPNELVNLYMLNALNISIPHIYNQSGLTENFRLFDGTRSEMTIEDENGVDRLKHNVDKGEGASNMMRILYPSSAGTLAVEGGYIEAFKRDCDPSPELMGEIVAHLYKYRKDKETGLKKEVMDPRIISNMSAYLGAKDEEDPQTGERKTASQIRSEIQEGLVEDYSQILAISGRIDRTMESKIPDIKNVFSEDFLNNKITDQEVKDSIKDARDKDELYSDNLEKCKKILEVIDGQIGENSNVVGRKQRNKVYGPLKAMIDPKNMIIESNDKEAIKHGIDQRWQDELESAFTRKIKFADLKNKYDEKSKMIEKTITGVGKLLMEFPSLKFIRKDSLTTFIALIKNAETMIDQESFREDGKDEKLLPKYTTEHMLMTYILNEFGNKSDIKKFYTKVQASIPAAERKDAQGDLYGQKLDVLDKTMKVFGSIEYNESSPYRKKAFGYSSNTKQFILKTDKDNKLRTKIGSVFSNCADTASRHLINLLSYDKENKWKFIYDDSEETRLEQISNKVLGAINNNQEIDYDNLEDRVKAFYYYQTKQHSLENTDNSESHTFWNYVISNMNAVQGEGSPYYNLKYNSGENNIRTNELLPGYINFAKLAYNIAYALKAGKGLKTANGTDYDGKEGQLSKSQNAIDTVVTNYSSSDIGSLRQYMERSLAEVFLLYDKKLDSVNLDSIVRGGFIDKDDLIAKDNYDSSTNNFNISRIQNPRDSLNFSISMLEVHADTKHNPGKNTLGWRENKDACEVNPQLMLLPDMDSYSDRWKLSAFDRLFTADPWEAIRINMNSSIFYNKFALQKIFSIAGDEGAVSTVDIDKIASIIDSKANIKVNGKNMDLSEIVKHRLADTVAKNSSIMRSLASDFVQNGNNSGLAKEMTKRGNVFQIKDEENNIRTFACVIKDGDLQLVYAEQNIKKIKLPGTVKVNGQEYPIASIAEGTFYEYPSLESITIPDCVKEIGANAFLGCNNLKSVVMLGNIESIGIRAFSYCTSLTDINIPGSVKKIGTNAFEGCESLAKVTIPGSVVSMGESVFEDCKNLTDVIILPGVKNIGYGTFLNCENLANVIIPAGISSIKLYTFKNCKNLKSIELPDGLEEIKSNSFEECGLESIRIPSSVKLIEYNAFESCENLKSIDIADGVQKIKDGAFKFCFGLESVYIPNSVGDYGIKGAFSSCRVKVMEIPKSLHWDIEEDMQINLDDYKVKEDKKKGRVRYTRKKDKRVKKNNN